MPHKKELSSLQHLQARVLFSIWGHSYFIIALNKQSDLPYTGLCRLVGFFFCVCVWLSHNITSARRPAESGHEVTDRCELLSDSTGGVIYPSRSVVESEASPTVSLTLYVWLRLNEQLPNCISFCVSNSTTTPISCHVVMKFTVFDHTCCHKDETRDRLINWTFKVSLAQNRIYIYIFYFFLAECFKNCQHLKNVFDATYCIILTVWVHQTDTDTC